MMYVHTHCAYYRIHINANLFEPISAMTLHSSRMLAAHRSFPPTSNSKELQTPRWKSIKLSQKRTNWSNSIGTRSLADLVSPAMVHMQAKVVYRRTHTKRRTFWTQTRKLQLDMRYVNCEHQCLISIISNDNTRPATVIQSVVVSSQCASCYSTKLCWYSTAWRACKERILNDNGEAREEIDAEKRGNATNAKKTPIIAFI